jgi:hypothetical protein
VIPLEGHCHGDCGYSLATKTDGVNRLLTRSATKVKIFYLAQS